MKVMTDIKRTQEIKRASYIKAATAYGMHRGASKTPLPHWDDLEEWVRDAISGSIKVIKLNDRTSEE